MTQDQRSGSATFPVSPPKDAVRFCRNCEPLSIADVSGVVPPRLVGIPDPRMTDSDLKLATPMAHTAQSGQHGLN